MTHTEPDAIPRHELHPRVRTAVMAALIVAAVVGLVITVRIATTGDNQTSSALPDSVDRLIPASGDEVLTQAPVGVDLASGYDAYLIVNGTEIRDESEGLRKDLGLGLVTFQPGPGTPVESLLAEQNLATAMVWRQEDGPESADPVSWTFTAA